MIALAGAPASGKSTVAEALVEMLQKDGHKASLVPMDGFHLDNSVLQARGMLARKGAPETFDLDGFHASLLRLKQGGEVVMPGFDRALDKSIAGCTVVAPEETTLVVEGNYLAFDEPGWRDLAALWDVSVRLSVPLPVLEKRLVARWLSYGLDKAQAQDRAMGNDIPNARRIAQAQLPTDMTVTFGT